MKKKTLFIIVNVLFCIGAYADGDNPNVGNNRIVTNSFWNNWFVTMNVAGKSYFSDEEKELDPPFSSNLFNNDRLNWGLSVSVGKWFSPEIGLRTKFSGIWGKNIISNNTPENDIKYWNLQEQILFNASNIVCGYNESRLWNLIPYVGVGIMRNCSDNQYAHGLSAGIINTWKVSNRFDLNFDIGFFISDDDIDADKKSKKIYAHSFSSSDRAYYAELGVVYHIGKNKWKKAVEYDAEILSYQDQLNNLNKTIAELESEKNKLKNDINELANRKIPEPVVKKKFIVAPVSVFFDIDSYVITSQKDMQNVEALVKLAIDHKAKLMVEGFADSKTGKADYNQTLSKKRAETIAKEIIAMGFNSDSISIVDRGGVDNWAPESLNRRVVVKIESMEK